MGGGLELTFGGKEIKKIEERHFPCSGIPPILPVGKTMLFAKAFHDNFDFQ